MPKKEERESLEEQIMEDPVKAGIQSIYDSHKSIRDMNISKYIDGRRITRAAYDLRKDLKKREERERNPISEEQKQQYIYHGVANLVASGGAFNEGGNKILLEKSLEELAKKGTRTIRRGEAKELLKGEKYLENTLEAFQKLYQIFSAGQIAEKMPELYKAVETVYHAGVMNTAINVMFHHDIIDDKEYKQLKYLVLEKVKNAGKGTKEQIKHYAEAKEQTPEAIKSEKRKYNAAASILAILGISLITLSGFNLTGNVIGSNFNVPTGIVISILFLFAAFLILRKKKRLYSS